MPLQFIQKSFFKKGLILLAPIVVWAVLVKNFFVQTDTYVYSYWIKYFFDGLAHGEFPLWDPFRSWGGQDIFDMRFIGEYNPFLYIAFILDLLGLSFTSAFSVYLVIYFFVGCLGFYLLAKRLFDDERLAYLAYVLFVFSCIGVTMFVQLVIVLVLFPAVWFFYFLLSFLKTAEIKYLLGITFSSMIIVTTYIPFFFLSFFLPLTIFFLIFYSFQLKNIFGPCFKSLWRNKAVTLLCLFSFATALLPAFAWQKEIKSGHYTLILSGRSSTQETENNQVPLEMISLGGAATEISVDELFTDLDLGQSPYFFISVFLYIILLLSLTNSWNRRLSVMFFTFVIVFLQSLTSVTPVHAFLYKHIVFYRLFRNYFFFISLLIPLIILFTLDHFRIFLLKRNEDRPKKFFTAAFIILVHGAFAFFLSTIDNVLRISYVTIWGSCLFFILYLFGRLDIKKPLSMIFLLVIMLLQPLQVCFYHFKPNYPETMTRLEYDDHPKFVWTRPLEKRSPGLYTGYREDLKYMQDETGFLDDSYVGTKWSYVFSQRMDHGRIQEYVRHKFLAYDRVEQISDDMVDFKRVEDALADRTNTAFVLEPFARLKDPDPGYPEQAQIFDQGSEELSVEQFGLNFIKLRTDFPKERFLVYNDSYHPGWRVYVDGKRDKLYRANLAFKGIRLDPGLHEVVFRYGHPEIYLGLVLYFMAFFIFSVIRLCKRS